MRPDDDGSKLFAMASRLATGEEIDPIELLECVRSADRMGLTGFADRLAAVLEERIRDAATAAVANQAYGVSDLPTAIARRGSWFPCKRCGLRRCRVGNSTCEQCRGTVA